MSHLCTSMQQSIFLTTNQVPIETIANKAAQHCYDIIADSIIADIIAKYYQSIGCPVYFLTGINDRSEHKSEEKDAIVLQLLEFYHKADIKYDFFVRTTSSHHTTTCLQMFHIMCNNGSLYQSCQDGWYHGTQLIPEAEASLTHYCDPVSGRPYQWTSQSIVCFRLEHFRSKLITYIQQHKDFITDSQQRHIILSRLNEPLQDVPLNRNPWCHHDWFNILITYLSGQIGYQKEHDCVQWGTYGPPIMSINNDPPTVWLYAVIWPCLLMACHLELPTTLIIHQCTKDVIPLSSLFNQYHSDTVRYYCIRKGHDTPFSDTGLKDTHNRELVDGYGNLVNRGFYLLKNHCHSTIPEVKKEDVVHETQYKPLIQYVNHCVSHGHLSTALEEIIKHVVQINQWLGRQAPWKRHLPEHQRNVIIVTLLEKIWIVTHLLAPYTPKAASQVAARFQHTTLNLMALQPLNLKPQTIVDCKPLILFEKFSDIKDKRPMAQISSS